MEVFKSILMACAMVGCAFGQVTYTTDADPTAAEVQALIDGASDGDTVEITNDMTVESRILINKGITLKGQGAGKIIGSSRSTIDFTTGEKTIFIWSAGGAIDRSAEALGFVPGETLHLIYPVRNEDDSLIGTVVGYSEPLLTIDITTVNGVGGTRTDTDAGDEDWWYIVRPPTTTLTQGFDPGDDNGIIEILSDSSHNIILEDFHINNPSGYNNDYIEIRDGGDPTQYVILRNLYLLRGISAGRCIMSYTNKAIVSGCSLSYGWETNNSNGSTSENSASTRQAIRIEDSDDEIWNTPSTFGAADTSGNQNFYIEDTYFYGFSTTCFDLEINGKYTSRNNVYDSSTPGGHGQDSGTENSERQWEHHDDVFVYKDDGTGRTRDMRPWIHHRGGTGVLLDCYFESNAASSFGGSNSTWDLQFKFFGNAQGPWRLYSKGDSENSNDFPSADYPVPQSIGRGYVDGSAGTQFSSETGRSYYVGDLEPTYIWNITGSPTALTQFGSEDFIGERIMDSATDVTDVGGDLSFNYTGHGYSNNQRIWFAGGTMPTGIAEGSESGRYYVILDDADNFRVSATSGPGAAIAYTDSGVGNVIARDHDVWGAHARIDSDADGIAEGEVIISIDGAGDAKPGYAKYTYPHPLVASGGGESPSTKTLNVGTLSVAP